ncbi:MAG: DUF2851 family protein, partial [Dehalococcoidales bacterium]|nr:DUF2851 family protein [Dehalococcoidales bacterium]
GIMEALGYSRNREPMRELAEVRPLNRLETVIQPAADDETCLAAWQGLLLGTAGLLPSQRTLRPGGEIPAGGWAERLERAWSESGAVAALSEKDWHLSRVRPGNYPARRIAAISRLLLRHRNTGLFNGFLREMETGLTEKRGRKHQDSLIVSAGGFWKDYLDFGVAAGKTPPALCGAGRAADILINVALPFAAAQYRMNGEPGEAGRIAESYQVHPGLGENRVLREMRVQLGLERRHATTARRQQGMMHVYKTWCSTGKCRECPLGKRG